MEKKIIYIKNYEAGKRKRKNNSLLSYIFFKNGYSGYEVSTEIYGSAYKLVSEGVDYLIKDKDIIVCEGGDGTLNEVVRGCLEQNISIPIGFVPTGTTNDFARGLGLSLKPKTAIKNIMNGEIHKIDIGMFNERPFIYTASFGLFTKASYSAPKHLKQTFGYLAYVLEGVKELNKIKSYHIKVKTGDTVIEDDYIFGGVCNARRIGGGVIKFKNADLSDGLLEVILIKKPKNPNELAKLIYDLKKQKFDSRMVDFLKVSKLEIETEDVFDWTIDGEHQDSLSYIKFSNKKEAMSLIF